MDHNRTDDYDPTPGDDAVRDLLLGMRRVAVVGISENPERASHGIARFLIGRGVEVVGVNPQLREVLGAPVYPALADVPGPIDVVDVFRRSEAVPSIVDEAIAVGARAVWLQEGVTHAEASRKAVAAGLVVVADRCIYKEWLRLTNG
jgi:uncharacterized protein